MMTKEIKKDALYQKDVTDEQPPNDCTKSIPTKVVQIQFPVFIQRNSAGNKITAFPMGWQKFTDSNNSKARLYVKELKERKRPNALARLTGKKANLLVLDIDEKEGPAKDIMDALQIMNCTHVIETVRGYHLVYLFREGFKNRAKICGADMHIDVRTEGGCEFITPTSDYVSLDKIEPKAMTDDQYKFLMNFGNLKALPLPSGGENLKKFIDGSGRNDLLFTRGCGMVNKEKDWRKKMIEINGGFGEPLDAGERDATIESVAKYDKGEYSIVENSCKSTIAIEDLGLLFKKGKEDRNIYPANIANITRTLSNHPFYTGNLKYNDWTKRAYIKEGEEWVVLDDHHYGLIQIQIQELYPEFFNVPITTIREAVHAVAFNNSYDSMKDYIYSLTWDKKERLSTFVTKAYGTPNDSYHKAVGENFMKGMVARVIDEGCKFDTVMILEGKEGLGKSTSFRDLVGQSNHLETFLNADKKDFFLQLNGKLIVEFSEGETLSRTESKRMKGIISTQVDTYRAPYGHGPMDVGRRSIFAMTTNSSEYLKDETGNRRFLPVEVMKVNNQWIIDNRDQLFAEALHRVELLKEEYWHHPHAEEHQKEKMVHSPYHDEVAKWLERPLKVQEYGAGIKGAKLFDLQEGISAFDVWIHCIGGRRDQFDKKSESQVTNILRLLDFRSSQLSPKYGRKTVWYPPEGK